MYTGVALEFVGLVPLNGVENNLGNALFLLRRKVGGTRGHEVPMGFFHQKGLVFEIGVVGGAHLLGNIQVVDAGFFHDFPQGSRTLIFVSLDFAFGQIPNPISLDAQHFVVFVEHDAAGRLDHTVLGQEVLKQFAGIGANDCKIHVFARRCLRREYGETLVQLGIVNEVNVGYAFERTHAVGQNQ